jgi:hypothetical protein
MVRFAIATATARSVAVPEPSSLMPGPSVTESRCAPTTTVRSARPPDVSASRFDVWRVSDVVSVVMWTVTSRAAASVASSLPISNEVPMIGMVNVGLPSVPVSVSVRPSWPSLKMITALAPAAWALVALISNVHVPRCRSATEPGVKPAKSAASQPLVLPGSGAGGSVRSTGAIAAVTSPEPEYCIVANSVSA